MAKTLCLLLTGFLGWSVALSATTVLPSPLVEQIDQAQLIFVGTAVHQEVVFPEGRGAYPSTLVTFQVDETLKGAAAAPQLTLQMLGGTWEAGVRPIPGMPRFEVGGTYLLMVSHNGEWICPVVGWWQGQLRMVPHPLTGEPMLEDSLGAPILGVSEGRWLRGPARHGLEDGVQLAATPGVEVVATEGVTIEVSGATARELSQAEALARTPPAAAVLSQVRRMVRERHNGPSFVPGSVVRSVEAADVISRRPRPTRPDVARPDATAGSRRP